MGRQADGQASRQAGRQGDRQVGRWADRETGRRTNGQTGRHAVRERILCACSHKAGYQSLAEKPQ